MLLELTMPTELSIADAVLLGLVQGLTEFLPVSSTAHLRIIPALLGRPDPGAAVSAVLQLGTLIAVLVYFAREVWALLSAGVRSLVSPQARAEPSARLAWSIVAGTVPVVVLGLGLRRWIEADFRSLEVIATMLALLALGLVWVEQPWARWTKAGQESPGAEISGSARPASRTLAGLTLWPIVVIGLFQALALVPGTSRSGATILGGMLLGLSRGDAARFSFLLGIPAILGSGLLQLPVVWSALQAGQGSGQGMGSSMVALLLGLVTAAVTGYAGIALLLRLVQNHTLLGFAAYRLLLAGAVLWLAGQGLIR